MSWDDLGNFAIGVIQTPPSPPTSGTSIVLVAGQGSRFPIIVNGFNAVIWPNPNTLPLSTNAEIVRVTAISTDTFTITRQQEGTSARQILQGDYIILGMTKKTITDIENNFPTLPLSIANGGTNSASASAARTALGLAIGTNVESWSAYLDTYATINPATGWIPISATLTYSSVDGHTFVVSTSSDMSGSIGIGDRVSFTNNSTTFYGIVTAITSSTITLYGGTNYSVANSAITNPFFSHLKSPYGFINDPAIWSEELAINSNQSQTNPVATTVYNLGSQSIAIPIGKWRVIIEGTIQAFSNGAVTLIDMQVSLSNSNSSVSDPKLAADIQYQGASGNLYAETLVHRENNISLTSKTTYYLLGISPNGIANGGIRTVGSATDNFIIRAVCNYL